jgi:hypothetical protein
VIRTFYEHLCQAGEVKPLALMGCMSRRLTILNTMVNSGTPGWLVRLFDLLRRLLASAASMVQGAFPLANDRGRNAITNNIGCASPHI